MSRISEIEQRLSDLARLVKECPKDAEVLLTFNKLPASQLASDLAYLLEQVKWIPVSERMPEKAGDYEVWLNGANAGQSGAHCPFPLFIKSMRFREDVTHWRELPAGLSGGKHESGM